MTKRIIQIIIFSIVIASLMVGCSCTYNSNIYGVWWWNESLDLIYIDYAKECDINEIYLCDTRFNDSTNQFIEYAKSKDIKVHLLMGEYQWIYDDSNLISKIEKYIEYIENETQTKTMIMTFGILIVLINLAAISGDSTGIEAQALAKSEDIACLS